MELIIKPTEKCNFKCSFCSSTKISDNNNAILDLQKIYDFLKRFPETHTIIVNGGDPLMMNPYYYWKLIEHLDEFNLPTNISLTTNLWPFYNNPKKWLKLFQHPRIGVCTSFNYGNTRLKGDLSIFSEEDFWNVSNKMLDLVGYRPDFISVITDENEESAIDNVLLAKRMSDDSIPNKTSKTGVECKLNYANASGPIIYKNNHKMGQEGKPFLLSKIYRIYLEIYDKELFHWEFNTKQMMKRLTGVNTICPQHRKCDEGIRVLQPEGDYYSCGAFGDDLDKSIDFNEEIYHGKFFTPLQNSIELLSMKDECFSCPMFEICNGCRKTIKDLKENNVVEEHCKIMKSLGNRILEINFAKGV